RWAGRRAWAGRGLAGEGLGAGPGEAAPGSGAHVRGVCRQAGFRPRVIQESPRAQAVAVMVAAGAGIALLPVSLARVAEGAAAVIPLSKTPPLTHVFAHRGGRVSAAMERFLALLDEPVTTGTATLQSRVTSGQSISSLRWAASSAPLISPCFFDG